jgi:hypothetical protein
MGSLDETHQPRLEVLNKRKLKPSGSLGCKILIPELLTKNALKKTQDLPTISCGSAYLVLGNFEIDSFLFTHLVGDEIVRAGSMPDFMPYGNPGQRIIFDADRLKAEIRYNIDSIFLRSLFPAVVSLS